MNKILIFFIVQICKFSLLIHILPNVALPNAVLSILYSFALIADLGLAIFNGRLCVEK